MPTPTRRIITGVPEGLILPSDLNVSLHLALDAFRCIDQAGITFHDRSEVPSSLIHSHTWTPDVNIHPRNADDDLMLRVHSAVELWLNLVEHPTLFPR